MAYLSKNDLISKVSIEGDEILIEAAPKKSVVLITAHQGNQEMAAQSIFCL